MRNGRFMLFPLPFLSLFASPLGATFSRFIFPLFFVFLILLFVLWRHVLADTQVAETANGLQQIEKV